MSRIRRNCRGFSLTEILIVLVTSSILMIAVMSALYYSSKMGAEGNARGKLRSDMESAVEQIKHDAHLSNANGILFYPADAASYTAISLPGALPDTNGLLAFSGGLISWSRTIIYHIYTHNGKTELRQTVFPSFQSSAATRQTQLDNVVANGDGSAGPGGTYTTKTLFSADAASMTINPLRATFDGYAPQTTINEPVSFGSLTMSAGNHAISFIVTGKRDASTGYGLGIDYIALSTSISGGSGKREAEALLPPTASSGDTVITENLSSPWSGNAHVEYQATGAADYITFTTYYDMWFESNFDKMTHSNTSVYGTDPYLSVASREDQSLSPAWKAQIQTDDTVGGADYSITSNKTYRCVASGSEIQQNGDMIRIMFSAGDNGSLTINSAYFGVRSPNTGNFASTRIQLYFDNGPGDPVGSIANPGVNTGRTIPAGSYVWTNWFTYNLTSPSTDDYLVSFYAAGGSIAAAWTDPSSGTQSYSVDDDHAGDMTLIGPAASPQAIASEQLAAWAASGTATSQIYDAKLAAPAYNQIAWTPTLPGASTVQFKVRSSANADMSGATDWAAVTPITSTPGSLAGKVSNLRYLQFQTIFQTAAPYTTAYPKVDNVKIDWPGQTALVEISGVFTKKPDYGIFKIQVDGVDPIKVLEFELSASAVVQGKTLNYILKSEERPANTGK